MNHAPHIESATLRHISSAHDTLAVLAQSGPKLARWGHRLALRLAVGGRLLVAGNGGSAAEAQHLTAELVGRFHHERRPFSAIALHADTSALTAIGNDYGYEEVFARQVTAHARTGDILLLLSTSGHSPNLLHAAAAARDANCTVWALTGPGRNPLADAADDAICLPGSAANVQESHLVAVHALCTAFDLSLP
jgi:D-sedoheptulose 7-phosphate isomerase